MELTWEILEKDYDSLEPDEKVLVDKHRDVLKKREEDAEEASRNLRETCKIVTGGMEKELIPAYGWIQPVEKMAYAIEALNIRYKKNRVYADFDQVKEKYGDFRGYYTIHVADSLLFRVLTWIPKKLEGLLKKINFKDNPSEISPGYDQEVWVERESGSSRNVLDGSLSATLSSGKIAERYKMSISTKWARKPGRLKILWKVKTALESANLWLKIKLGFLNNLSKEDQVVMKNFDEEVEKLVNECETECRKHCIRCGSWIDSGPRYSTRGWYTYICKRCAELTRGGASCCDNLTAIGQKKTMRRFGRVLKGILDSSGMSEDLVESGSCKKESLDNLCPSSKKSPVEMLWTEEDSDDIDCSLDFLLKD